MTAKALQITTPTDTTIVLTRTFKAKRRLVWQATIDPAKMRRWMLPPPGWTLTVCEVDPRLGGALSLAWKSAEADPAMTLKGVFTEWSPHERMAHTETMALGSGQVVGTQLEVHEFAEQDGVTTMRITQTYPSKEDRDGVLASGATEMEPCYVRLDAVLAETA